jgi:hypothetical protein
MYYVYEWFRMDLNLPYYIGKGKGRRAFELTRTTPHTNTVTEFLVRNGIKREVRVIAYFKSEEAAFAYEKERIAFWWYLKEHNVLTNQTLGGEGISGFSHNSVTRKILSEQKIGGKNPMKRDDVKQKNKKSQLVAQNRPEVIKKKSDALKAKGEQHSSKDPVVQNKISHSLSIYYAQNEHHGIGTKASVETKTKQSVGTKAARARETDEQKLRRGQRIWETRRKNGTAKGIPAHNRTPVDICGVRFETITGFCKAAKTSFSHVKKLLARNDTEKLQKLLDIAQAQVRQCY